MALHEDALSSETAEKVDFAGGDSIDAILRRPHGPSDGLGEDVEGNLLPRNATPKSTSDFFSGLVEKGIPTGKVTCRAPTPHRRGRRPRCLNCTGPGLTAGPLR